jgi:hypothetical protein
LTSGFMLGCPERSREFRRAFKHPTINGWHEP